MLVMTDSWCGGRVEGGGRVVGPGLAVCLGEAEQLQERRHGDEQAASEAERGEFAALDGSVCGISTQGQDSGCLGDGDRRAAADVVEGERHDASSC
jgi:hypothetical protein